MVGFNVGFYWYQIGSGDILHSFFSTVAVRLEDGIWGQKYPHLMNELYQGKLEKADVKDGLKELLDIKEKLKNFSVDQVVWDFEDLSKQPPWGDNIAPTITDLSNYYVTNDGEDFITIFEHSLEKAIAINETVIIEVL